MARESRKTCASEAFKEQLVSMLACQPDDLMFCSGNPFGTFRCDADGNLNIFI